MHKYARTMAEALAVLHWTVGCDARDVEFVLGSESTQVWHPSTEDLEHIARRSGPVPSDKKRATRLWLLDFNQVAMLNLEDNPIPEMVAAHTMNDPYYPKPLPNDTKDEPLWDIFSHAYLGKSNSIAGTEGRRSWATRDLPKKFLEGVVEDRKARRQASLCSE